MALLFNGTRNGTVQARANQAVQTLNEVMSKWQLKYGNDRGDGYLFPYDPLVFDKLLAGHGAGPYYSVPFYTLHKLMQGLLDQYTLAGNELAFGMVKRMAAWVGRRVDATLAQGGEELWQRVLLTEWGGMNDVLFELYEATGDASFLATGRKFNAYVFTAPLVAGQDTLGELPF